MIDLNDQIVLPGLINAHDHLQFGLFPRLGRGTYPSWREWASDIYQPAAPPLRALLDVPKETRLWWGILRNLLSGVTTVCHHDALHPLLAGTELPLTVHSEFGWAHSLDDVHWREQYARTPGVWPFIVHCGEGVDSRSRRDVAKFRRGARLDDRIVFVHAVGISQRDWLAVRAAGVGIVWCPTSDLHILGRTIARDIVLSYPSIALGNDSPISAAGDLIDELRTSRALYDLPPELIYRMVTTRPARLLRLPPLYGSIAKGGPADLLVVRDKGQSPCDCLVSLSHENITAVMHRGEIVMASTEFSGRSRLSVQNCRTTIRRQGLQWHVAAPADRLYRPDLPAECTLDIQALVGSQ